MVSREAVGDDGALCGSPPRSTEVPWLGGGMALGWSHLAAVTQAPLPSPTCVYPPVCFEVGAFRIHLVAALEVTLVNPSLLQVRGLSPLHPSHRRPGERDTAVSPSAGLLGDPIHSLQAGIALVADYGLTRSKQGNVPNPGAGLTYRSRIPPPHR